MINRISPTALAPLFALTTLITTACDEPPVEPNVLPDLSEARTFYGDVAPIIAEACGTCHSEGGVAPMSFNTYEDAVEWAPAINLAVQHRTMPPMNVNNDGSCNTYTDARWLSDEQLETIDAWVQDGLVIGDPSLGMPPPPPLPTLAGDSLMTLRGPVDYHPASEGESFAAADDYQCFMVDPQLDHDKFLVGFDVDPGNDALVHHVIGFNVDLDRQVFVPGKGATTNRALIDELKAESPDSPGWDCFAAAGQGVMIEGVPVTWAPGTGATRFPEGTGIRIASNEVFVLQMHYNLADDNGEPDTTQVQLDLVDEVDREAHMALADGLLMTLLNPKPAQLPAGLPDASFEWSMALDQIPNQDFSHMGEIEVLGVLPHMHERGQTMSIEFDNGGERDACGAQVDAWNFEWQQAFFLEEPVRMDISDTMNVRCTYDTRTATGPTGPGFGTGDEMCLAGVYIAPVQP